MKIIIAPNSFKDSLDAFEVSRAIEQGFVKSRLKPECVLVPIADGGDATVDVFNALFDGRKQYVDVRDPIGRERRAYWSAIDGGKTAVIEMAKASGVHLLRESERDPFKTTTYGTGQLIADALDKGAEKILLGLGGSATVDAGLGILQALGAVLRDEDGRVLPEDRNPLIGLGSIDISSVHSGMHKVAITILSDVENPLLGRQGAAKVFGPQKGADDNGVERLESLLVRFNDIVLSATGTDYSKMAGAGAAGGIAVTLKSYFNTEIVSGIDYLLDKVGFDELLRGADLIVSAEGKVDSQTLKGKGPIGVIRRASSRHVPSLMFAGHAGDMEQLNSLIDAVFPITNGPQSLESAIANTAKDLEDTATQVGNLLHAFGAGGMS
jgi:glycerate kinase